MSLGNLQKLNAGDFLEVLKYSKKGTIGSSIDSDFISNRWDPFKIGPSSEIIDVGNVRTVTDVRTELHDVNAYCIYFNDRAVFFTASGADSNYKMAYDLSEYEDTIDEINKELREKQKNNFKPINPTSRIGKYYVGPGKVIATDVKNVLSVVMKVAQKHKIIPTMKIVKKDFHSEALRQSRVAARVAWKEGKTYEKLEHRLARYKVTKKPFADTIQEFLDLIVVNDVVNFRGVAWRPWTATKHKDDFPTWVKDLKNGTFNKVSFYPVLDQHYRSSLDVTLTKINGKLTVVSYEVFDNRRSNSHEHVILQPKIWFENNVHVSPVPEIKDTMIKGYLEMIKYVTDGMYLSSGEVYKQFVSLKVLDKMYGWPELKVIETNFKKIWTDYIDVDKYLHVN